MTTRGPLAFDVRTLDALTIDDERSFRHVALYADLKQILLDARYPFRVLPAGRGARWDRALLLNLTFWGADGGGDVVVDDHLAADVVAHVAWHHLATQSLARLDHRASIEALFLGESIASAFDLYLVGRLLGHAPRSSFLASQVPAMADAANEAGLDESGFETLLASVAASPERAFADLRALLFDASMALFSCKSAEEAFAALAAFDDYRFAPLLHRYELSNWVLYARAYGDAAIDEKARSIDHTLKNTDSAIDWLTKEWVAPTVARR